MWSDFLSRFRRGSSTLNGEVRRTATVEEMGLRTVRQPLAGQDRTWYEYVPTSYTSSTKMPLLMFFHALNQTGALDFERTQMYRVAEARGFIAVFPTGSTGKDRRYPGWSQVADQNSDEQYVLELLAALKNKYNIDAGRVYFSGFSNGSNMAHFMALRHPELITAISSFAGTFVKDTDTGAPQIFAAANNDMVLPVWMWFGELDLNSGRHDNSTRAQTFWKRVNGVKVGAEAVPGHFGEDADQVVTEGRLTTYVYEGTHADSSTSSSETASFLLS